jgi:hypothetical protein
MHLAALLRSKPTGGRRQESMTLEEGKAFLASPARAGRQVGRHSIAVTCGNFHVGGRPHDRASQAIGSLEQRERWTASTAFRVSLVFRGNGIDGFADRAQARDV